MTQHPRKKPRKSLRTLLMVWFLLFSIVPLAFITGYSLVKYEQAIDQELAQRLDGNQREIEVILGQFEAALLNKTRRHARNNSLVYHMSRHSFSEARSLAKQWLKAHIAQRISLFDRDGRLVVALFKGKNNEVKQRRSHESTDVYLSADFLKQVEKGQEAAFVDVVNKRKVELIVFSRILNSTGRLVGYLEEIVVLDKSFLQSLKNRLGLEVVFFGEDNDKIVGSHEDLILYKPTFFRDRIETSKKGVFDLMVQGVPYGFMVRPLSWGTEKFYMAIGASKAEAQQVLENVNYAFFTVVGAIIFLLVILSVVISRILLRPLSLIVEAIRNIDMKEGVVSVKANSNTELGLVADSFNRMSLRIHQAQRELQSKIKELEQANQEIRDTQAKLVHTAKMASLGQLVAGVAHELNNPIGFIYSNMSHLRDYSQSLISLVQTAEDNPSKLTEAKKDVEFDYIVEDMPKLIRSCEEGARRTRDIVLGLRTFSRLDEAKAKETNLEESIEGTLQLLTSELKNRIKVVKEFSGIPPIYCYPSQLNQVFMNILSNAAHAIEDQGEIHIKTESKKDQVFISIRDTGSGMDKETREKVFDPFFTTKGAGEGTGLGLSISYGIVEKHGGEIRIHSEKGKGTEFVIVLPVHGPENVSE